MSEFTLEELMITHQALIASKRRLVKSRVSVIKQHGNDVYDQLIDRHRSAVGKITKLAEKQKASRDS